MWAYDEFPALPGAPAGGAGVPTWVRPAAVAPPPPPPVAAAAPPSPSPLPPSPAVENDGEPALEAGTSSEVLPTSGEGVVTSTEVTNAEEIVAFRKQHCWSAPPDLSVHQTFGLDSLGDPEPSSAGATVANGTSEYQDLDNLPNLYFSDTHQLSKKYASLHIAPAATCFGDQLLADEARRFDQSQQHLWNTDEMPNTRKWMSAQYHNMPNAGQSFVDLNPPTFYQPSREQNIVFANQPSSYLSQPTNPAMGQQILPIWALNKHPQNSPANPVFDDPFSYQLAHANPEIDAYIKSSLALGLRPTSYQNYVASPTPGVKFFPGGSSSGYHINGLPIENKAFIDQNPKKHWLRYSHLGFVELNDKLFDNICPADLNNRRCIMDEVWTWDPDANKWMGGCQMLRLCRVSPPPPHSPTTPPSPNHNTNLIPSQQVLHYPRPAAPALSPSQYALHVDERAHSALMKIAAGDPATLSLFTTHNPTSDPAITFTLPLLATTDFQHWPVLAYSATKPGSPAHIESCPMLHGIAPTCMTIKPHPSTWRKAGRPETAEQKAAKVQYSKLAEDHRDPTLVCNFGHELKQARVKAYEKYQEHQAEARKLLEEGKAVRCQVFSSGERNRFGKSETPDVVKVWVMVPGYAGDCGAAGRFVIDGGLDIRAGWDIPHQVGFCSACGPPAMGAEAMRLAGIGAVGADEEEDVGKGKGKAKAKQSVWEKEEVEEGLMAKWRGALGRQD